MNTCSGSKKTAKCRKPNVNRCHFQSCMCWEQPLNLLSIEAFTDYIVHYFRCVFFFRFPLLLSCSPVVHFSSVDGGFRFLICCCCCCCCRVSPSLQCSSRARVWVCVSGVLAPNKKCNKKNYYPYCIIENHVEFDNFQLSARNWRSLFRLFFPFLSSVQIYIYIFRWVCNSKSAIDFRVASRLGVCYLIFADAYFSRFFFSCKIHKSMEESERRTGWKKNKAFSPRARIRFVNICARAKAAHIHRTHWSSARY